MSEFAPIHKLSTHERIIFMIRLIASMPIPQHELDGGIMEADDTANGIITEIFLNGNDSNFAIMLYTAMNDPKGRIVDMDGHYVYGLEGKWYDITGECTQTYPSSDIVEDDGKYIQDFRGNWHHISNWDNKSNSNSTIIVMTLKDVQFKDMCMDNYSFGLRGPIV